MEGWVTGQPHLLYETVELLFAYVNRIPAVELTQEGLIAGFTGFSET